MKSVSESMKEVESKKSLLQEQVDQLNEDCARLKAQGSSTTLQCICLSPLVCEWFCILGCNSCIAKTRPIATDRVVWSVCWSLWLNRSDIVSDVDLWGPKEICRTLCGNLVNTTTVDLSLQQSGLYRITLTTCLVLLSSDFSEDSYLLSNYQPP